MYQYIGSKKNSDNETEIKLRLRLPNRTMIRVDTGIWIDVKRWGKNNTINIPINAENEKAMIREKKDKLELLKSYLTKVIDNHAKTDEITREWVQGAILNFHQQTNPKKNVKINTEKKKIEIIEGHSSDLPQVVPIKLSKGPTMVDYMNIYLEKHLKSESRKKHFKTLIRSVNRYEMYKTKTGKKRCVLYLVDLNSNILADIEQYLSIEGDIVKSHPDILEKYPYYVKDRTKTPTKQSPTNNPNYEKKLPKNRGLNYVADLMIRLRSFVIWAYEEKHTDNNPFKSYKVSEPVYGTPIYITIKELKQLYNYDLSYNSSLSTQRDIFVFQCCIGCRVGDYLKFTNECTDGNVLRYIAGKTKDGNPKTVEVPLNNMAKEILNRYTDPDRKLLFPFISADKYNDAIKLACKAAGLNRKVVVPDVYTRKAVYKELHEVATSHMARRTLVGNLYKEFKDQNLVSAISGHKEGSKAFARYRDIDLEMKTELVNIFDQ